MGKNNPETRKKISKALLGHILSKETKDKIRIKALGRIVSTETRLKISKSNTGKKRSSETRDKMRQAMMGNKNSLGRVSPTWKGNNAGCSSIQEWVSRKLGTSKNCSGCGSETSKKYAWVLKSKLLDSRTLDNYERICFSCLRIRHHSSRNLGLGNKGKKISDEHKTKLRLLRTGVKHSEETKKKISLLKKAFFREHPEKHANAIMSRNQKFGKGYISKGQTNLYQLVKNFVPSACLNYPVICKNSVRYIDVAVLDSKIGFEYDSDYWHQNQELDNQRDHELNEVGWRIIHIRENLHITEDIVREKFIQSAKLEKVRLPLSCI